ncbi:MAG: hypothetical protein ACRDMH_11390 [Solirubrobacterales bacterium]
MRVRGGARVAAFGVLIVALAASASAEGARPGALDDSFGGDGTVRTMFAAHDYAYSVAFDPRGRIVAGGGTYAGDLALARYRRNGTLDHSFSGDGRLSADLRAGGRAVVVDGRGRIVAAAAEGTRVVLVRYTPGGNLDGSFGTGGETTTNLECVPASLALDSQGRIVVGGGCHGDFTVARFNADGDPDDSFGPGGIVTTDFGGSDGDFSVAIDSRDRIVAAGDTFGDLGAEFAIARYNRSGHLDSSFGVGGQTTTSFGNPSGNDSAESVAIDSLERIVAAGFTGQGSGDADFALARYNPAGTLNILFGPGGTVTTSFGPNGLDFAHAVAIDSRGRIVAAGGYGQFQLARYHPNGTIDRSFSRNGKVRTGSGSGYANAVAIDSRDRIVAAGSGSGHFRLMRFVGYR